MQKLFVNVFFLFWLFVNISVASQRGEIIRALENLPNNWSEANFKTWLDQSDNNSFRIGDNLVFNFLSDRDAHVFMVLVDNEGVISVIFPDDYSIVKGPIRSGQKRSFPAAVDTFPIEAQPPVGMENIFVFATEKPIDRDFLDVYPDDIPPQKSTQFLKDIQKSLSQSKSVAMGILEKRLLGRSDNFEYSSDDIVAFFETRSRSYSRPNLPLHVEFNFGSHQLTAQAKKNLDIVADALTKGLDGTKFMLGGHTDNVGTDEFNLALSEKRAETTKRYLISKGVASSRVVSIGFGETEAIESNNTPEGRHANRRVDLQAVE